MSLTGDTGRDRVALVVGVGSAGGVVGVLAGPASQAVAGGGGGAPGGAGGGRVT